MKKYTAAILLSTIASTASAGDSGAYGEILLGGANTETDSFSASKRDTSFGLRGGYNFTKFIAAELAYQSYGEPEKDGLTIETTAFNLNAKGIVPINDQLSLNLRLGASYWDSEASGGLEKIDDDGIGFYWGFGGQYNVTEQFIIGLEYSAFSFNFEPVGYEETDIDISNFALSIGFSF